MKLNLVVSASLRRQYYSKLGYLTVNTNTNYDSMLNVRVKPKTKLILNNEKVVKLFQQAFADSKRIIANHTLQSSACISTGASLVTMCYLCQSIPKTITR